MAGGRGRKKMGVAQGGEGGERFLTNNISSTYSTNQIPSDTQNCLFPGDTCLRGKYCFFHNSQPAKFCLKNAYLRADPLGAPVFVIPLLSLFTYFVVTNYNSLAFLDVQRLYAMFFMLLHDIFLQLDWLEHWYFSLI